MQIEYLIFYRIDFIEDKKTAQIVPVAETI